MPYPRQRIILMAAACMLILTLNACGLLTVERIVEQQPTSDGSPQLDATAINEKQDQQDALLEYLATQVSANATQNARQEALLSYLATRGPALVTPVGGLPPTPLSPVVGNLEIEDGVCCVGGTAGEEITITVRFTAIGLEAPVTEMRYRIGGYTDLEGDFNATPWEAFMDELSFSYQVPINWSGFYVRVQYRDSLGNLSPVYTDDISVEGNPPLTPSPGG